MPSTVSARDRLRVLGQGDLGAWIELAGGRPIWSIQHRISRAVSRRRSRTAVPSCNASGKTHLAARLALAFYDAYTPGAPCHECDPDGTLGGCRGSKVITTSSKYEHLKDNLWGEIRLFYPEVVKRVGMEGHLPPKDLFIHHRPDHFIIGQSTETAEGFQGYHAAHKLIIGDEATSVSEEVSQGITSLLASGDSRLLLIFNPTDDSTYAAKQTRSETTHTIKITAFDTPHFTGEPVPPGSNLITPTFLEELKSQGMGPGTYEWTTRVEANFWGMSDDILIAREWYDQALTVPQWYGARQMGVDIAPYGTSENTIVKRNGNTVESIEAYPAMRVDVFFDTHVTQAVLGFDPDYLIYDADGVGAGAIGYAEKVGRHMRNESQVIGFRGALGSGTAYNNTRSAWWWALRRKFENGQISLKYDDPKLREQLTTIRYSIQAGKIRVETKGEMKKRGVPSPDRGDGLMYAFAMSDDLPTVVPQDTHVAEDATGVRARDEEAMWRRTQEGYNRQDDNAIFGVPD